MLLSANNLQTCYNILTMPFNCNVLWFVQASPLSIVVRIKIYKIKYLYIYSRWLCERTWIIPFWGVDKSTVERINAGDCMQNAGNQAARSCISALAFRLVDQKCQQFKNLFLVFEKLNDKTLVLVRFCDRLTIIP